MAEAGHSFLARLGKKRLRPGGIRATSWLRSQGNFSTGSTVLEVACNMGTTAVELAQAYGCSIIGIDRDITALEKARRNIQMAHVDNLVTVMEGDALALPFEDGTFDIVINEAMLTMLRPVDKVKAVQEYWRDLKKGGILLTHDVRLSYEGLETVVQELSRAINVHATPLTAQAWEALFSQAGFTSVTSLTGPMSLMSPRGLIKDEGFLGALHIVRNGLKKQNRPQFKRMFSFFRRERRNLGFIAVASRK